MLINRHELNEGRERCSYEAPDLTVNLLAVEHGFAASSEFDAQNPDDIFGDDLIDDSNNWGW